MGCAPHQAFEPEPPHQPSYRATGHDKFFALELLPDLAHAVDTEVVAEDPLHLDTQRFITLATGESTRRTRLADLGRMRCRWGNPQFLADRLGPIVGTVAIDKIDHHLGLRSSSAWAKKAEALRRISLDSLRSKFSRFRRLKSSSCAVVAPGAVPNHAHPAEPQLQALSLAANLLGNPDNRSRLGIRLAALFSHHLNLSFPDFRAVSLASAYGSILSNWGVCDNPGTVHQSNGGIAGVGRLLETPRQAGLLEGRISAIAFTCSRSERWIYPVCSDAGVDLSMVGRRLQGKRALPHKPVGAASICGRFSNFRHLQAL